MTARLGALAAIAVAAVWLAAIAAPEAHKTVVSKFTYNQDVRPIVEEKCARCHVTGGIARSLSTYTEASMFPWALQQELLSKRMPPFGADPGLEPLKGHQQLTTVEFDTLMTWAAGGAPEGAPVASPIASSPSTAWPLGPPDQIVEMPSAISLPADQAMLDTEVIFAAPSTRPRVVRAIDLQPGTPAMVRRAEILIRAAGADRVAALWLPGDAPQLLERQAAFDLPANAVIAARIHYARPAEVTGPLQDRSRIGIYFAKPGAPIVEPIVIGDRDPATDEAARTITHTITRASHLVALRPISGPADAIVRVTVIDRGGARTPVARLTLRREWPRRYVLAMPLALASGSRVEVSTTPPQSATWESLIGGEIAGPASGGPLRMALEVVR